MVWVRNPVQTPVFHAGKSRQPSEEMRDHSGRTNLKFIKTTYKVPPFSDLGPSRAPVKIK